MRSITLALVPSSRFFCWTGRDRGVDDDQLGLGQPHRVGDLLDLARPEQGRRARAADLEMEPVLDRDADRLGKARRLVEARLRVAPRLAPQIGQRDDGAGAAGHFIVRIPVENAQPLTPRPALPGS